MCLAVSAQGSLIVYDGFDYSPNGIAGNNGGDGDWAAAWTDTMKVYDGTLTYGDLVVGGGKMGNVEPSPEDREVTSRLHSAGCTLGIAMLDHIIFSQSGYYSFLEQGEL